jgi:hypothetical protein
MIFGAPLSSFSKNFRQVLSSALKAWRCFVFMEADLRVKMVEVIDNQSPSIRQQTLSAPKPRWRMPPAPSQKARVDGTATPARTGDL